MKYLTLSRKNKLKNHSFHLTFVQQNQYPGHLNTKQNRKYPVDMEKPINIHTWKNYRKAGQERSLVSLQARWKDE